MATVTVPRTRGGASGNARRFESFNTGTVDLKSRRGSIPRSARTYSSRIVGIAADGDLAGRRDPPTLTNFNNKENNVSIKISINDLKTLVAQLDNVPAATEGKTYGVAVKTGGGIVQALISGRGLVTIDQDGAL